jgi:hypothetical protein
MTHRIQEEHAEALAGYLNDRCGVNVEAGDVLAGLVELKLVLAGNRGRQSDSRLEHAADEAGWHSSDASDFIAEIEAEEQMDLET